jgi:hypothetical protein
VPAGALSIASPAGRRIVPDAGTAVRISDVFFVPKAAVDLLM